MFTVRRAALVPFLLAAALGASACGSDVKEAQDLGKELQQQGQQLQADAEAKRKEIEQISEDIKSGKLSAEEGQKQIEALTDELQKEAADIADKGMEGVKNLDSVPDSAKQDLEEAQQQLKEATK